MAAFKVNGVHSETKQAVSFVLEAESLEDATAIAEDRKISVHSIEGVSGSSDAPSDLRTPPPMFRLLEPDLEDDPDDIEQYILLRRSIRHGVFLGVLLAWLVITVFHIAIALAIYFLVDFS